MKLVGAYKAGSLSSYDKHTDKHSMHNLNQGKKILTYTDTYTKRETLAQNWKREQIE